MIQRAVGFWRRAGRLPLLHGRSSRLHSSSSSSSSSHPSPASLSSSVAPATTFVSAQQVQMIEHQLFSQHRPLANQPHIWTNNLAQQAKRFPLLRSSVSQPSLAASNVHLDEGDDLSLSESDMESLSNTELEDLFDKLQYEMDHLASEKLEPHLAALLHPSGTYVPSTSKLPPLFPPMSPSVSLEIMDSSTLEPLQLDSVKRKRRKKMNKHKWRKRRKIERPRRQRIRQKKKTDKEREIREGLKKLLAARLATSRSSQ